MFRNATEDAKTLKSMHGYEPFNEFMDEAELVRRAILDAKDDDARLQPAGQPPALTGPTSSPSRRAWPATT